MGAGGGRGRGGRGGGAAAGAPSLSSVGGQLSGLYGLTQEGNGMPASQTVAAVNAALRDYQTLMTQAAALLPAGR